jgi:hypothetical protein
MVTRQSYTQLGLVPPALLEPPTGQEFYVHNGTGSDGNPGTKQLPFKTLDYAIGRCTSTSTTYAGSDTIYLLPGHAENVATAGAITCDVIGVTIIGLGKGNARPTFTWSATAGTWLITAASVTVKNIICKASIDSVVTGISISAAGCTLDAVDFIETSSVQMLIFIQTAAGADQLTIQNCRQTQLSAGSDKWIDLIGCDDLVFKNNNIQVKAATHVLGGTTTESLCVYIANNVISNYATDAGAVILLANSTGMVVENYVGGAKSAIAGTLAIANCYGGENYVCNTVSKNGLLDPVADS